MRKEGHVAVPGEKGTLASSDGQAGDAGIIEENRLNHGVGPARARGRLPHGLEMRRAKLQQPIAVAGGRFGEQHDRVSVRHRLRDLRVDLGNAARAAADRRR